MKRLKMRKIRDALRLEAAGLSTRKIAASLALGQSTASDYLCRARTAGLSWPLPTGLTDAELEGRLFSRSVQVLSATFPQPDWAHVHAELRRKGVTLALLWEEYRHIHTDGYPSPVFPGREGGDERGAAPKPTARAPERPKWNGGPRLARLREAAASVKEPRRRPDLNGKLEAGFGLGHKVMGKVSRRGARAPRPLKAFERPSGPSSRSKRSSYA